MQSWLGAGSTFSLELAYGHGHLPADQVDHSPPASQMAPPNGWLDDVDAWYAAFGVKEGDTNYVKPEDRVRIW